MRSAIVTCDHQMSSSLGKIPFFQYVIPFFASHLLRLIVVYIQVCLCLAVLMPRSHLHEYLCQWPCDHAIKQYSYGYAICQEFSIMRMPCDCHASSMRIHFNTARLPCDTMQIP